MNSMSGSPSQTTRLNVPSRIVAAAAGGHSSNGLLELHDRRVRVGHGDHQVVDAEVHGGSVDARRSPDRPGIVAAMDMGRTERT